jgi:hypothetical protein
MPATVEAHLYELRRHHPGWGQRRLAHELVRIGVDPPPGLTSIYRALVRNGLIEPRPAIHGVWPTRCPGAKPSS